MFFLFVLYTYGLMFYMQAEVAEYHKIKLDIAQLEKKMMTEITRPERVLYFLLPGRLVCAENGQAG